MKNIFYTLKHCILISLIFTLVILISSTRVILILFLMFFIDQRLQIPRDAYKLRRDEKLINENRRVIKFEPGTLFVLNTYVTR